MCNEAEALRSNQVVLNSDYGMFELAALGKDLVWVNGNFYRIVDGVLSFLTSGNVFFPLPGLEIVYVIDDTVAEYGMFSGENEFRPLSTDELEYNASRNIMLAKGRLFVKKDQLWEPAELQFSSDCWLSKSQAYVAECNGHRELVALFEGFYSIKGEILEIYGGNLYRLAVDGAEVLWSGRPLCFVSGGKFDEVRFDQKQNLVEAFGLERTYAFQKQNSDWVRA